MPDQSLKLNAPNPYSLIRTLRLSTLGQRDPTCRLSSDEASLCWNTPDGPASLRTRHSEQQLTVDAWGSGAGWICERAAALLGLQDPTDEFEPTGRVRELCLQLPGTFLPRLPLIFDRLIQTVLQQLVSWDDAASGWQRLVQTYGQPATGPVDLLLPPSAEQLKALPYYDLVACGILPRQARLILKLAKEEARLERLANDSIDRLSQWLNSVPGIGPWTIQYVRGTALGDPDAVIVGDYALPHTVSWFLSQKPRSDDQEMLKLLAPWKGHRFRVQHLLMQSGITAPRRGPKMRTNRQRFGI